MMSAVSGWVVLLGKIARIVRPPPGDNVTFEAVCQVFVKSYSMTRQIV